eukprot:15858462-Heterocapsa_arctica.AAC.1
MDTTGARIEHEGHKDYRFRMELRSYLGWVPHAYIYAWIKVHAGMGENMTPEMFWQILLHTIGNVDKEYSYRVIFWPGMKMAFVKVEKTTRQLGRAQDNKRKFGYNPEQG